MIAWGMSWGIAWGSSWGVVAEPASGGGGFRGSRGLAMRGRRR